MADLAALAYAAAAVIDTAVSFVMLDDAAPQMAICLATSSDDGKGSILCNAPDAGKGTLKANEWLKESLAVVGGKGGGKPDSAQGQVPDAGKMDQVLAAATTFANDKL